MVYTLARATGWTEETILWMPLKRSLQYLHAAWLGEGVDTGWRTAAAEEEAETARLFAKLRYLTRHG